MQIGVERFLRALCCQLAPLRSTLDAAKSGFEGFELGAIQDADRHFLQPGLVLRKDSRESEHDRGGNGSRNSVVPGTHGREGQGLDALLLSSEEAVFHGGGASSRYRPP